jgi:Glutamine amidotransferase domain
MRGMIAIIAHDRMRTVDRAEIDDFAATFEFLRGKSMRYSANAGSYASLIRFNTTEESRIESDGESWVASIGLVLHSGSVVGQPLESLDGQFALVSFNAANRAITVAVDPLGLQALYVAERDGKTYVSTSALALAKYLRARPSRFALQVFLRAGYHFGGLTNWEGIERLPPGTAIVFTDKDCKRHIYWRPEIDDNVTRLGFHQAADHLIETATETFATHLNRDTCYCTNLTGGYDSRLLNLLLRRAGVRFRTNTRGDDNHPDVRIAARVAKTTQWDWLHIRLPSDWPRLQPAMIETALAWGDSHLDVLDLSAAVWQPPELGDEPVLFNGGGAELMRNFAWQQELMNVGKARQVNLDNWLDMRLLHPMDTSVLAVDPTPEVRDDFRRRMLDWTRPFGNELNTTQLDMMYAYKCTGHFGLYGPAFGAYGLVQSPLFFKPIFRAAVSTHWRHRNSHAFMRQMIERLDPRVASITTTSGGPAQPMRTTNFHRFLPYYADVGLRLANKLTEKALGRGFLTKSAAPSPRVVAARQASLSYLANGANGHSRGDSMRSASLYNREKLKNFLSEAAKPQFREAALFGRMITVELALRATDGGLD